jgi:arabinogalactan oligomer/maltooligosaccharide transport system substrate-binding protein
MALTIVCRAIFRLSRQWPPLRPKALLHRLAGSLPAAAQALVRRSCRPSTHPPPPRTASLALLALLIVVTGCSASSPFKPRQTLHVVLVPADGLEWLRKDYLRDSKAMEPLLRAFRRLQPGVDVQISLLNQNTLSETLRARSSRGLGPDLLLLRSPQAISLLEEGLINPLPTRDASVERLLRLIKPSDLHRVGTAQGIAGLPVFNEFTLACYDRRRVQQPPTTLAELLAVAASGRSVGLAVDPTGLWWTAGALGAAEVMARIVLGTAAPPAASTAATEATTATAAKQREALVRWLTWLRQAVLQSRVEIASGPQELTLGLESGQLAWAPCFSPTLMRLDRTMGRHLGVTTLPSGPEGPPSPYFTTRVWALGRDSTPEQRRLALQLAALSLDPLIQRQLMLLGHALLPANRFVPIPVASSGRLATLAAGERQFLQGSSSLLLTPFSLDRLQPTLPRIEAVITDVMVGLYTPQQGADALLALPRSSAQVR